MAGTATLTPEAAARHRAKYLAGLVWHAGAYLIINAFFWILDLTAGARGIQWALWITVLWGFAVAFHALAYVVDGSMLEQRKARQYLEETERRG